MKRVDGLKRESSDWFCRLRCGRCQAAVRSGQALVTFNEPQIFVGMGYQHGTHAPGDRLAFTEVLAIAHNVLLAHGKAVQIIRNLSTSSAQRRLRGSRQ